ncbi:hypothetical protein [Maricaulis sp.]|uniref:hypothetical protein n=1 Tax=Maricaulis sp. TaxID=1486257 RepID=UPI003A90939E
MVMITKLALPIICAAISILLSGCTTRAEIDIYEVAKVSMIGGDLETVSNITLPEFVTSDDGYWVVSLRANMNLERIVDEKHMAFLYYRIRLCESGSDAADLLSAPAYIDRSDQVSDLPNFTYLAVIPNDYRSAMERYASLYRVPMPPPLPEQVGELCIGLGAGNMAGEQLSTNYVRIRLE